MFISSRVHVYLIKSSCLFHQEFICLSHQEFIFIRSRVHIYPIKSLCLSHQEFMFIPSTVHVYPIKSSCKTSLNLKSDYSENIACQLCASKSSKHFFVCIVSYLIFKDICIPLIQYVACQEQETFTKYCKKSVRFAS